MIWELSHIKLAERHTIFIKTQRNAHPSFPRDDYEDYHDNGGMVPWRGQFHVMW